MAILLRHDENDDGPVEMMEWDAFSLESKTRVAGWFVRWHVFLCICSWDRIWPKCVVISRGKWVTMRWNGIPLWKSELFHTICVSSKQLPRVQWPPSGKKSWKNHPFAPFLAIYWSSRPQHLTNRPRHHRLEASTYSFPAQGSDVKKKRPRLAEGTLFHGHFPHANRQIAINSHQLCCKPRMLLAKVRPLRIGCKSGFSVLSAENAN